MTITKPDETCTIPIRSDVDIVRARQKARELAAHMGFGPTDATLIATAVSELARNIVEHARTGEISLSISMTGELIVVASDHGPGIADIQRAMQGGFSTSGGLGLGLLGVRQLMDDFEITSEPHRGTVVRAVKARR